MEYLNIHQQEDASCKLSELMVCGGEREGSVCGEIQIGFQISSAQHLIWYSVFCACFAISSVIMCLRRVAFNMLNGSRLYC